MNINPNPRFVPTPGKPTAAKTGRSFNEDLKDHRNMAQVMRREAICAAAYQARRAAQFGKDAE